MRKDYFSPALKERDGIYISPPKTNTGDLFHFSNFLQSNLQKVLVDKPVENAKKFWEN
jgi:hypothetical protein